MGNFSGNIIPGYMMDFIPKQQVRKVNGINGAKGIHMDKDSTILILDEKEPIVYFCQTDSFGNLSVDPYDISPHQTEEQRQTEQILSALTLMNSRLEQLEAIINESDTSEDGPETASTEFKANQGNMEYAQLNGQSQRGSKTAYGKQSKGPRG